MRAKNADLPWMLLLCAGLVLGLSMGTRHVQGLFMLPLLTERGWGRESFSFALGLQVLVWGLLQPITGWIADRFGTGRVIAVGCALYAAGLLLEAWSPSVAVLTAGAGVLVGVGMTATTFAVVYGALARLVAADKRSTAQGIAGGIGGFVQFVLVPLSQAGIDGLGWSQALVVIAALVMAAAATAWVLDDRRSHTAQSAATGTGTATATATATAATLPPPSAGPVVRAAMRHSGFWLLNLGFVSCGFQLAFLGTHLPAYLRDAGMDASAGVRAIALIALANAVGTYVCGRLGDLYRRKYLLAALYSVRTLAMLAFVLLPLGDATLYAFAIVMGATWLGTVPLTTGVLTQIFGVRYIGTLFGLVFLGHQIGGFAGAWLGGTVFDATQSYGDMWFISILLGVASVLLNLPIRDRSIEHTLVPARA